MVVSVWLQIPRANYDFPSDFPDSVYVRANYHIHRIRPYSVTIRLDHISLYGDDFQLVALPPAQSLLVRDYLIETDSLYRISSLEFRTSSLKFMTALSRQTGTLRLWSDLVHQPVMDSLSMIESWRRKCLNHYRHWFQRHLVAPVDQVAMAVILNQTQYLDTTIKDIFRYSGLYPVLVISGLHFAMIFLVLKWMLYFFPGYWWKRILIIIILSLYLWLVGWKSSLGRAYLMILLYQLAPLFFRKIDKYQALFLSAFLIALANPPVVAELAFQLTYLATLGIMLIIDWNDHVFGHWKNPWLDRLYRYLVYPVSITFGAIMLSAPIINYYFEVFNPYSFIANLLTTLPLTIFILTGFSGLLLAFLPGINAGVWGLMNLSGSVMLNLTEWLAAHPWAYYRYHLFATESSLWIYYGVLAVGTVYFARKWFSQTPKWIKESL